MIYNYVNIKTREVYVLKKNNFSNEITKLATVNQARERYKISRVTLMKYAKEFNAIVRIGRSVRIDCTVMDEALRK